MMFERVRNFKSISNNHDKHKRRKQKIGTIQVLDHLIIDNQVPHISELTNSAGSFYNAIKPVIMFGQLFGLFPIDGITNNSSRKLTFKLKSFRSFYSIIIIMTIGLFNLTAIITLIHNFVENPSEVLATVSAIIYFSNSLMTILFYFIFCPKWIKLQQKWTMTENKLKSFAYGNLQLRQSFKTKSLILLVIASIEHILCYRIIITSQTITGFDLLCGEYNQLAKAYNLKTFRHFSETSFFQFVVILYLFVANKFCAIIWNYSDLFIVLVATGLAERYKHLNDSVIKLLDRCNKINWHQCRKEYALLSTLVKETNNIFSPLILISYFTNLYFICIQLFNGIFVTTDDNVLTYVYYFMSFTTFVVRIVAITLSAARIHSRSKIILPKIYCCSSSSFNIETKRLQYQLTADKVTLTGMRFFSITRQLMLTIVSAVITYELIILQFVTK